MEGVNKHADRLILAKRSKRTFINKKDEKCTPNNHGDCMLPEISTKITMKYEMKSCRKMHVSITKYPY